MKTAHWQGWVAALGLLILAPMARAQQACEGGAYLNPQLFRGEAAHHNALADQELRTFITRAGLPAAPLNPIKHVNEVTASTRAPYCWVYANLIVGVMSGYKPAVINTQPIRPALLAITQAVPGAKPDAPAVPIGSLPVAEQKAVLDRLQRSKCYGTTSGVGPALIRAEGLCGLLEEVAPQGAVGQQGLIARAAFAWDDTAWQGIVTREESAAAMTTRNLVGRSDKIRTARLIVVPTKGTTVGFGLYVHPSLPQASVDTAVAAFKELSSPSKALAIALDLEPGFSFATPSANELAQMAAAIGLRK